jgi:malate dehydrogenase (oxaloacetate-decarboxylating)(NADP+)
MISALRLGGKPITVKEDFPLFLPVMTPLEYHRYPTPGKFKTVPSKALEGPEDLSLAYSPGVAEACQAIVEDPSSVNDLTIRQNLVAVISNGTAVLGLGNIGALASKPVMEGKAVLFQALGRLQSIDIEVDQQDPEKFIETVANIALSFGGINLEDIKAPECFIIEQQLQDRLTIPVFHDDQHGTAITVASALKNALHIVGKNMSQIRCVVSGAGAGAIACIELLRVFGLKTENLYIYDSQGLITEERSLPEYKRRYAQKKGIHIEEALEGADVFLGLSCPGALSTEGVKRMAERPIIFALANPVPEIYPYEVQKVRSDALVGTGRSDYPNQVNNLLCFPYIFRGALDAKASRITLGMKVACVDALTSLAQKGFSDVTGHYGLQTWEFGAEYFLPKPFDPRLLVELPVAVARAAIEEGVAKSFCLKTYERKLQKQAYHKLPIFQTLVEAAGTSEYEMPHLVYEIPSAQHLTREILAAARAFKQYGIAQPVFWGNPQDIGPLLSECPFLSDVPVWSEYDPKAPCIFVNPPKEAVRFEGFEKDGACLFRLGGHVPQEQIHQIINFIEKLGFSSYIIDETGEFPGSHLALPSRLKEGIGYLRIGKDTPYSMDIPLTWGPFWISKTPLHQSLPSSYSFRDILEISSFALFMHKEYGCPKIS